MIKGLDAIVLIVKDIEKQKQFYKNVLGLEVESDHGNAVFFKLGKQRLAIFSHSCHKEGTASLEGAQKGISHLEFRIARKDQVALDTRLKENGFHAYRDNYHDADGNLFHFNIMDE